MRFQNGTCTANCTLSKERSFALSRKGAQLLENYESKYAGWETWCHTLLNWAQRLFRQTIRRSWATNCLYSRSKHHRCLSCQHLINIWSTHQKSIKNKNNNEFQCSPEGGSATDVASQHQNKIGWIHLGCALANRSGRHSLKSSTHGCNEAVEFSAEYYPRFCKTTLYTLKRRKTATIL